MATVGQPFTSGNWIAKEGKEDELVAAWTEFVEWSVETMGSDATETPILIRETNNPRHFISFGGWKDSATVEAWRQDPGFGERIGRLRELCEEFTPGDYTVASAP